jgi:hypothetical protein
MGSAGLSNRVFDIDLQRYPPAGFARRVIQFVPNHLFVSRSCVPSVKISRIA